MLTILLCVKADNSLCIYYQQQLTFLAIPVTQTKLNPAMYLNAISANNTIQNNVAFKVHQTKFKEHTNIVDIIDTEI